MKKIVGAEIRKPRSDLSIRIVIWLTLLTLLLAGCLENIGREPVEAAVQVLNDAIETLESQSMNWQSVLEETRDKLIAEGQSTVAHEVSDVLSRAISDVGIEARCYTDFLRDRVREDLIRIRAKLTGESLSLVPVFCNPTPSVIDMNLPPERRPYIEISGYNLENTSIQALLIDAQGGKLDVTFALDNPSQYLLTINLGSKGVPLSEESQKLVFILPNGTERSVAIIQPVAPVPEPQPVTYDVTLFTGCVESGGTDAHVYIILIGSNGRTEEQELLTENYDQRQACAQDSYRVISNDLGDLVQLEIRHDNCCSGPGWFLDKVVVRNRVTGQSWEFPCQKWLAVNMDNGQTSRTIYPGGPCN